VGWSGEGWRWVWGCGGGCGVGVSDAVALGSRIQDTSKWTAKHTL